jgi:hypothetical protein
VRKTVRAILESYLQNLDIFPAGEDEHTSEQGNDDLFQKIQILEDGSLSSEDLAALNSDSGVLPHSDAEADLLSVFGGDEAKEDNENDERI